MFIGEAYMRWLGMMLVWLSLIHPEIHVQGTYHKNDIQYIYGSHEDKGYMLAINQLTEEIIFEISYGHERINEFKYLADVGDYLLIINRNYYDGVVVDTLLKYDLDGFLIDTYELEQPALNWHNHHYLLILEFEGEYAYVDHRFVFTSDLASHLIDLESSQQYQGDLYLDDIFVEALPKEVGSYAYVIKDGDYQFSYSLMNQPHLEIIGEPYKDGFHGQVVLYTDAIISFEGHTYRDSLTLNNIGIHRISLQGYNYEEVLDIVIYPQVSIYQSGENRVLSDDDSFHTPIYLFTQADKLTLNGDQYDGGLISNTGYYQIDTWVSDNIVESIYFKIEPMVEGLENNGVYEEVSFYVFGQASLNGESVEGLILIDEPGQYHLDVLFENSIYESYDFEIIANEAANDHHTYIWIASLICLVSLIYIYLKK
jgi:hypothetical protein